MITERCHGNCVICFDICAIKGTDNSAILGCISDGEAYINIAMISNVH